MPQSVPSSDFVTIDHAVKRFQTPERKSFTALDSVSLGIAGNEFVTLLGPSGCGKTTLLRTISGLEELDEGEIHIDGRSMNGIPAYRRPVNTVFQNYALFPHLSVGDNVGYSLDVSGVNRTERNHRISESLDLVGLTGMERRMPRQLSGGQQQRVALARAFIGNPKLLLLDEPLSALDRGLRQQMQLELKNLQHELGISFVFVTHDQEEALTMSDRIAVLNQGRIEQLGTPTEIYDTPKTEFVARFVGESNIFRGQIHDHDGEFARLHVGDSLEIGFACGELAPTEAAEVNLMIRPERLYLADVDTQISAHEGTLRARLRQSVFVGTDHQLHCELHNGQALTAYVRDAARDAVSQLKSGDEIDLRYRLSAPVLLTEG